MGRMLAWQVSDALTYIDKSKTDWITDLGLRDRSFPYNNYPQEWTPARKKALDQMQVRVLPCMSSICSTCQNVHLASCSVDARRGQTASAECVSAWHAKRADASGCQVLTVQTPYKDEDLARLTDKLYVCPQVDLGPILPATQTVSHPHTAHHLTRTPSEKQTVSHPHTMSAPPQVSPGLLRTARAGPPTPTCNPTRNA